MKKILLSILFTILCVNSYSQINFEDGYYINNSGKKINCFIKNIDWKNTPTEFEYKLSKDSLPKVLTVKSVKEFGINNTSKYIRNTVDIDRSSETLGKISTKRNPIFKEETIFLKVLVEGNASLYQYIDGNLRRYFYNKLNSKIEQLIFKSYKISVNKIAKNNRFRQQLWNNLKCSKLKNGIIENLKYRKDELINLFSKYNQCINSNYTVLEHKKDRDLFNLSIRPRLNSSSLEIHNSSTIVKNIDFGNQINFGVGIEGEFLLPFNKNKWGIIIEPTYQYFKANRTNEVENVSGGVVKSEVNYSSIEVPIGLRYYLFINKKSQFFINASYIIDFSFNSTIEMTRNDGSVLNSLEIGTKNNLGFGVGYKLMDKYSAEIRYQTNRDILGDYAFYESDYSTISLIIGYSFF